MGARIDLSARAIDEPIGWLEAVKPTDRQSTIFLFLRLVCLPPPLEDGLFVLRRRLDEKGGGYVGDNHY